MTEFMPKVPWGGKYNIISCPAGFHVAEGRWLKDKSIISDYLRIWMTSKNARPRAYTFAAARAAYDYHIVAPDAAFLKGIFGHLKKNSAEWEKERRPDENYLFWQYKNSQTYRRTFRRRTLQAQGRHSKGSYKHAPLGLES